MKDNKVLFGISDVAVAFQTESGYEKPTPIPGAVSLSADPKGEQKVFYADNIAYYTVNSNSGYDGDLEIANIPDEVQAKMLGWKIDKNGVLVEVADGVPTPFALLFSISGDVYKRKNVLYNVTASRPSNENKTAEESTDPAPLKLPYIASPIDRGGLKVVKASVGLKEGNKEAYDTFSEEVYLPDFNATPPTPAEPAPAE